MSLMECKYISVQARTRKMNHEWESCSKDNSEKKKKQRNRCNFDSSSKE